MTIDRQARLLCRVTATINWTVSLPAIIDPIGVAGAYGSDVSHPFLVRLINGWVFMFGCMFWETGRDVRAKSALFKYNWIEKSVVAGVVTLAYLTGEAPPRLMLSVFLTNWLWIPVIFYYDRAVRRLGRGAGTGARSLAPPRAAGPEARAT
jgi:hypothetical protein